MTKTTREKLDKMLEIVKEREVHELKVKKNRINKICKILLKKLKSNGIRNPDEIYTTLHIFGHGKFYEARSVVEKFLRSKNPRLRYIALNVLCLHWQMMKHAKTCMNFIQNEKDEDNRRLAIGCLGLLYYETRNKKILSLLIKILKNRKEDTFVRDVAYYSIQDLVGIPQKERKLITYNENKLESIMKKKRMDRNEIDQFYTESLEKQIDWNFIKSIEMQIIFKKKAKEDSK